MFVRFLMFIETECVMCGKWAEYVQGWVRIRLGIISDLESILKRQFGVTKFDFLICGSGSIERPIMFVICAPGRIEGPTAWVICESGLPRAGTKVNGQGG